MPELLVSLAATLEGRLRDLQEPIADVLQRALDVQLIGEDGDVERVLDYLLDKQEVGAAPDTSTCYRVNLASAIERYEAAMRQFRTEFIARLVDTRGMSLTAAAKTLGITRQAATRLYEDAPSRTADGALPDTMSARA
jgi:predicted DNA-binding protein (UPF0251 family)